jgi:hypothetical protein
MEIENNKSFFAYNDYLAYKMRNLYSSNNDLFYEIANFIPNLVYINKHRSLDYVFTNENSFKSPELDVLFERGGSYLAKISCPILLDSAIQKVRRFTKSNDYLATCSYI